MFYSVNISSLKYSPGDISYYVCTNLKATLCYKKAYLEKLSGKEKTKTETKTQRVKRLGDGEVSKSVVVTVSSMSK